MLSVSAVFDESLSYDATTDAAAAAASPSSSFASSLPALAWPPNASLWFAWAERVGGAFRKSSVALEALLPAGFMSEFENKKFWIDIVLKKAWAR